MSPVIYRQITRHPAGVSTYEIAKVGGGRWTVSQNEVWIPGVYDTEATAVAATKLPDEQIVADLGHIYRADGQNRPVTMADLDALAAKYQ